jgi:predicted RNA polymerase sigma factor
MLVSGSSSLLSSLGASALAKINAATAPKATTGSTDGVSAAGPKSAKDEFLDYAKLTPAQKMRAAMLSKLGVTEEELKAMDPKERQKIEDQIKEMVKQQVMGDDKDKIQKGALVDLKA